MDYKKPFTKRVSILGELWTVIFEDGDEVLQPKYKTANGWTDNSVKEIHVGICDVDETSIANMEYFYKRVMRHEIVHAFLYESGLDNNTYSCQPWALNEEMIDWIARQFPKMQLVMKELDTI